MPNPPDPARSAPGPHGLASPVRDRAEAAIEDPWMSVIILNYNGDRWLKRCLESIARQTIFACLEVIVADNASSDGSAQMAADLIRGWRRAQVILHGLNLGYCEGNNRAAREARGRFLLFLNNDTWLEPDCLEQLHRNLQNAGATAGCPLVLDYQSDRFQSLGAEGLDLFGFPSTRRLRPDPAAVLMPEGCAYCIDRAAFERLGGFDPEFFMYADEWDLSWRVWLAGYTALAIPSARLHHWGAAQLLEDAAAAPAALRTSESKRFLANRNSLLVLLKHARGILWAIAILQVAWLCLESLLALLMVRRISFIRRAYCGAFLDCWRLRRHIRQSRRQFLPMRRHGDIWFLRFLRPRFNRWDEW
ncbi:MAG TPA: glycosyltransferase family 2 protein, partial [Candidatus Paceibacterota bacterium]|nr:glycosyltransferase family 2 protein [Candidatus Paceibacterota bacterium]